MASRAKRRGERPAACPPPSSRSQLADLGILIDLQERAKRRCGCVACQSVVTPPLSTPPTAAAQGGCRLRQMYDCVSSEALKAEYRVPAMLYQLQLRMPTCTKASAETSDCTAAQSGAPHCEPCEPSGRRCDRDDVVCEPAVCARAALWKGILGAAPPRSPRSPLRSESGHSLVGPSGEPLAVGLSRSYLDFLLLMPRLMPQVGRAPHVRRPRAGVCWLRAAVR